MNIQKAYPINLFRKSKTVLLLLTAFLLTVTTVFFGISFLKTLYKMYSPWIFWSAGLIMFTPMTYLEPITGSYFISLIILVGVYSELEKRGFSFWKTSAAALLSSAGFWAICLQWWLYNEKLTWIQGATQTVQFFLDHMGNLPESAKNIDILIIVHQLPGILIGTYFLNLGLMLIFEKRSHLLFGYKYEKFASQIKLLEFTLPDFLIWITLVSMLLSCLAQTGSFSIIAQNILTMCAIAYLFQGIAVVEIFLRSLKTSPVLKFFVYFALVGQLLLVLSAVGFLDFWFDFRKRLLIKKKEKQNIF